MSKFVKPSIRLTLPPSHRPVTLTSAMTPGVKDRDNAVSVGFEAVSVTVSTPLTLSTELESRVVSTGIWRGPLELEQATRATNRSSEGRICTGLDLLRTTGVSEAALRKWALVLYPSGVSREGSNARETSPSRNAGSAVVVVGCSSRAQLVGVPGEPLATEGGAIEEILDDRRIAE